jgi:hypothetical protein
VDAGPWIPVTGLFCAQDELVRNAGGTPGCGTADGAARRTRGTQTGSPPVPAGRGCRHPACGAPAEREASTAFAMPVRTRNPGTRVRTLRTGSLAPRPAPCRAAAARAADCPTGSYIHGRTAVSPVGTARGLRPESCPIGGLDVRTAAVYRRTAAVQVGKLLLASFLALLGLLALLGHAYHLVSRPREVNEMLTKPSTYH